MEQNYYYDPDLRDPRLEIYPPSSYEFPQERWVVPLCLIEKDSFVRSSYWGERLTGNE